MSLRRIYAGSACPAMLLLAACGGTIEYRYAFIDTSGQVKIQLRPSQYARTFSEGMAASSLGGKWGFINTGGKFVIAPEHGWVGDFSDGLAPATEAPESEYWATRTVFGYIDTTGTYVIPPRFNWVGSFSEGVAPVCAGPCRGEDLSQRRVGYVDRKGRYVLPPRYRDGGKFSGGLAPAGPVGRNGTGPLGALSVPQGFIDRSGRFRIEPRYLWAGPFHRGLAATNEGFVDATGRVSIRFQTASEGGDFTGELAVVTIGDKHAFVDTAGQVRMLEHQGLGAFSEGLAAACMSDCGPSAFGHGQNWGYVDRTGAFVIKPQFGYRPGPFRNGLALVCFGCKG